MESSGNHRGAAPCYNAVSRLEMCWYKKPVSVASSQLTVILLTRSFRRWQAVVLMTPKVSAAIGSKRILLYYNWICIVPLLQRHWLQVESVFIESRSLNLGSGSLTGNICGSEFQIDDTENHKTRLEQSVLVINSEHGVWLQTCCVVQWCRQISVTA